MYRAFGHIKEEVTIDVLHSVLASQIIIMKSILVLSALVAICYAAPQDQAATILRYDNENIGIDGYKYGYETSNGISHDEEGTLQNVGSENESIDVHGSYKYTDEKSGKTITVTYVSGENGFRPQVTIS